MIYVRRVDTPTIALLGVGITVAVQIASVAWIIGRLKAATDALATEAAEHSARLERLAEKLQRLEVDVKCNARDLHFTRNTLTPIVLNKTDAEHEHRRATHELLERVAAALKERGGA